MFIKANKVHPSANLPFYSTVWDGSLKLVAAWVVSEDSKSITYGTGIAIEVPEGHVALILPKRDIGDCTIRMSESVGLIDSGYRSEIVCRFDKDQSVAEDVKYKVGDVIAQIIVVSSPQILFGEVEN